MLIFKAVVSHGSIQKCCGFGEYLHVANGTHQCVQDTTKRVGIVTNSFNFIKDNTDGECVDYSEHKFFNFSINNGDIVLQKPSYEKVFVKCCPLGYKYNSQLHACTEDPKMDQSFITEKYVRVGLPNCKLIVDKQEYDSKESDEFCIDKDQNENLIRRECSKSIEDCDNIRCIKKCCPDGQSFVNGAKCTDTYIHGLNLSFSKNILEPSCKFLLF